MGPSLAGIELELTADGGSVAARRHGAVVAEGRLDRGDRTWQLTAGPPVGGHEFDADAAAAVLAHLRSLAERTRFGADPPLRIQWLVSAPTASHDRAADAAGLVGRRDLLQLRRPLPVEPKRRAGLAAVATRSFRAGIDEQAWLEVNNRAFADHPDQSAKTVADLRAEECRPWFDPSGFLLLDAAPDGARAGHLDGFCWTKVHADHDPPLGEIYVIGVDPSAHGKGLGPALTVAGLDHLHRRGLAVGMLYVDVDNAGAVRMYERLGFATHHVDRIYLAPNP